MWKRSCTNSNNERGPRLLNWHQLQSHSDIIKRRRFYDLSALLTHRKWFIHIRMEIYILEIRNSSFFRTLCRKYLCLVFSLFPIYLRTCMLQTATYSCKTRHQFRESRRCPNSLGLIILNFLSYLNYVMKLGTSTTHFKCKEKLKNGGSFGLIHTHWQCVRCNL
jgi:hypothetical protein